MKQYFGPNNRSSNDDRSDSLNPNNSAYQSELDNRSDLQNPNNDRYDDSYNSTK